jgi:hypothetical protein
MFDLFNVSDRTSIVGLQHLRFVLLVDVSLFLVQSYALIFFYFFMLERTVSKQFFLIYF